MNATHTADTTSSSSPSLISRLHILLPTLSVCRSSHENSQHLSYTITSLPYAPPVRTHTHLESPHNQPQNIYSPLSYPALSHLLLPFLSLLPLLQADWGWGLPMWAIFVVNGTVPLLFVSPFISCLVEVQADHPPSVCTQLRSIW